MISYSWKWPRYGCNIYGEWIYCRLCCSSRHSAKTAINLSPMEELLVDANMQWTTSICILIIKVMNEHKILAHSDVIHHEEPQNWLKRRVWVMVSTTITVIHSHLNISECCTDIMLILTTTRIKWVSAKRQRIILMCFQISFLFHFKD